MPHYPKPFHRANRGLWYVQIDGRQHNLGPNKDEAFRRYHQLMQAPAPVVSTLAAGVIDGFLEWTKQHRAARTYAWYLDFLQSFISSLPDKELATDELKPFHVHRWVDAHKTWGASCKRGAITAVQRAFLWAEKLGHIDKSPIRHVEKPKAERRDNPLSQEDFEELISQVKDQPFRDLLQFCWDTGCRPQEARHIEARHFVPERSTIELPPDEAKGKKRWRIIYLPESSLQLVRRLALARPTGKLFRNRRGQPWKNYAICNRFARLKAKLGRQFALYDLRHSFATRLLMRGSDPISVAALLGHVDGTMLCKNYEHISSDAEHLRRQLDKGAGTVQAGSTDGQPAKQSKAKRRQKVA
jgi:integrase